MQVTYDFSGKSVLLIGGTTGIGPRRLRALSPRRAPYLFVSGIGAAHGASLKEEIKATTKVEIGIPRSRRAQGRRDGGAA